MKIDPRWVTRKRNMVKYARNNNIEIPDNIRFTPVCGASCVALIRNIQRKAFGPLRVTGEWDSVLDTLVRSVPSSVRVYALAEAEIGTKEHPANSNDGPRVRQYQQTTGAYKLPWCASFVTWCFKEAGRELSGFNTAYCPSWVQAAKANRNGLSVVSRDGVKRGDCALYDWQKDGTSDHIGIVSGRVSSTGEFSAIEGNTSYGNDSNGGEVLLRTRNAKDVLVFVRVSS